MKGLHARLVVCATILIGQVIGEEVKYTIPTAYVERNKPNGFSVSIPHSDGIELFAFHGNLNSPVVHTEACQFSADISKHINNRWTFTNQTKTISRGDKLYYSLYVLKDGLGYRLDNQKHIFTGNLVEYLYKIIQ